MYILIQSNIVHCSLPYICLHVILMKSILGQYFLMAQSLRTEVIAMKYSLTIFSCKSKLSARPFILGIIVTQLSVQLLSKVHNNSGIGSPFYEPPRRLLLSSSTKLGKPSGKQIHTTYYNLQPSNTGLYVGEDRRQ